MYDELTRSVVADDEFVDESSTTVVTNRSASDRYGTAPNHLCVMAGGWRKSGNSNNIKNRSILINPLLMCLESLASLLASKNIIRCLKGCS